MPREELRWTPGVPDCDLMMYLRAARSMAAFAGMCDGGSAEDGCLAASRDDTTINALDLLHDSQYDTGRALQALVKNPVPRGLDKKWTDEDQKRFVKGLRQYGKNFFKIRKELLSHKETADLVEFYYLWKKTPGAATSRPHRRHRRQNVLRRSRPSSRLTKVAQNEFADASSASEEEESADDSDSREVPAYMCHSCLATSSKEWFQTGKEGSVLCWDCCQQKKGTEAVRPLSTSDGDGAPPFLFKPVDGDALNGKHVMRTRRNKENQNHTKGRSKHGSNNGGDGASPENMDGALTANNRTTPGGRKSPAASTADKDKKKKTNPDTPTKGKKRGRDEATPASNALPTTPTTPNASPVEDSAEVPAVATPITTAPSPVNEEDDKTAASSAAKKKKGEAAESPVDSPGGAEGLSSRSSSVGGGAASNEENAPEEPEATSVSPPSVSPSPTAAPTPAAVPPATSVAEEPSQTASMPPQLPSPVEEERPSSRQPEPSLVANDGPPKEARCSPAVAEDAPVALPISRPPCPSPVSLVMPGMPSQVPHLERSPQLLPPRMSPPVPPPAHQLIGRGVSTPPTRNLTPSPKLMMSEDKFDQLLPQAPPTLSLPDPREKSPAAPPDAMPLSLIKMEVEESKPLRLVSSPSSRGRPTPPLPLSGSMNPSLAALSAMPPPPVEPLLPSGMMPPTVKSHLVRIKEEMSGPPTLLMEGPPRGLPPSSSSGVSPLPPEATQSLAATGPPLGVPRGLSPLAPLPPSSSSCLPASSLAAAGASAPPRSSPSSVPGAPVDYPGPPPHHVKTEPPPSPPKERLSAPSPPHHMPSFSHSSSPAHIKPVPCSLSMPTPPTSTPASSASSHHYPFSPPLFATSSVAVSTAASPLGGGYPSPLVTAGRPPPGAAPPPGAPPQVHPGFPYPAYFSPQLYSPHLHFPQTHPQFAPPPPAPPPPAHQATAPQHHSKTPPSRAPVSMPLPPQLPLDGGGGGSGHRVAPPSHHGGSGGHHSGGLSSHHSSSSSHHGGPVHHIVPEEEEEEPEAQQLVRGPSPEPKVEDSECHRSQSAIFLRHWSRGEFNSCARTDLTFKPVPDSKLARKREERARKAAEKEREEAKQRLSSLEHRSGASESKAGPSGHPCDFPPGANPYRTAPPRGAVTNPYAAAAAAAAAADTPALRQLSEYARPHAGFSPSGYPSARAHPAAAAAAAAAAAMDPMMLHYQLGMYAAAAAASRENSLRLDLELEKRELQDKLKAELELKSRLPQAYDPHWLELQRRYAAAAGLGAAGGALGAAAAGMSPFALYGDQRDRLGLPPDDRLHPAADRLALAAADPLLRLQMAGELHAVPPTHAHAHTHLHLHPPHHDPLSAAAVAMAMPPGGEPPPTAGPYATGYPPGGPGAAPPGSAGGPPRGAPHGPPPGGPRPQDLMHPAAAALMRSSYEEQLAHQINAAQVAAAQQQQQHEQLQRQFMLERERLAHLSALGAAHAASAHQAQAAQLLPQHEEFLRWRPTVPRQDLSSDCSATARRCSQQQQRERELKLRTLEEAARGGRPPIN